MIDFLINGGGGTVCIVQNKGAFRKFLTENGFNVPAARSYSDPSEALDDLDRFMMPVIVKPTDSAGSKGVTRVDDVADIGKAIDHALSFQRGRSL